MSERCDRHDTVAAYLLGALPDAERHRFEAHLADCAPCREDAAELRIVADALLLAAPPVPPPRELRERLMATVRAEADVLSAAGPHADSAPRAAGAGRRGWWRRWLERPFALAGAAAAVAAVGIALGFGLGSATNGGGTRTVVAVRTVRAAVSGLASRGTATIVERDGVATLRVTGLPVPPPGKVYEVWLLRRGASAPSPTDALFSVSHAGSGRVALPSVRDVTTLMVTAEPDGGSPAPTARPFITASL